MTPVGWLRFMEDYKASAKCFGCEKPAVRNGFCDLCATEIEDEIALADDAPPKEMTGRISYGTSVDPFGKDAA